MTSSTKKLLAIAVAVIFVISVSAFILIPYLKFSSIIPTIDYVNTMPGFEGSTVVVSAKHEGDKDLIIDNNSDTLIHPGSNYKMLTATAALHYLGPDFIFKTKFYIFEKNGKKNLLIKGSGDPTLRLADIQKIAKEIKKKTQPIDGDLYYDDSYFSGEQYGPDWKEEWKDIHFAVPISALQIDDNLIYVMAGKSTADYYSSFDTYPLKNYKPLVDNIVYVEGKTNLPNPSATTKEDGTLILKGERSDLSGFTTAATVRNPSLLAAEVFKQELVAESLMSDDAKVLNWNNLSINTFSIDYSNPFYEYDSKPLSEIVKTMLTFSKNNYGETLIRTLGEEMNNRNDKNVPEDSESGSQEKGVKILKEFLATEVGIDPKNFIIFDGCGMSPSTRITGRAIMQLFDYVDKQTWRPIFWSALPTSNKEGTLYYRFLGLGIPDSIVAKTGTHEFASSLSGKIIRKGLLFDDNILFSIHIFNHQVPAEDVGKTVHPVIDSLVKLLDERF